MSEAQSVDGPKRPPIFISYSRRDMAFADRLAADLTAARFAVSIDRTEIYSFEDWWERIEALIVKAYSVIFIISPDFAASGVVRREVKLAASLNKRLAPVLLHAVPDEDVPPELARLNYIYFDDHARYNESLAKLVDALSTDIEWVRMHTELGEQARRWSVAGRPGPRGLLLRSPALEQAEHWIASIPSGAPPPTEDVRHFILESRRAATRRRNSLLASLTLGMMVALVFAAWALWERNRATANELIAHRNEQRAIVGERQARDNEARANTERDEALRTQSRFLSDLARQQSSRGDNGTAVALALEALPDARRGINRPYVGQAEEALYSAAVQLREQRLIGSGLPIRHAAVSQSSAMIATTSDENNRERHTVRLWDAASGALLKTIANAEIISGFSRSGTLIAVDVDGGPRTPRPMIWNVLTDQRVTLSGHADTVSDVSFSPDDSLVATASFDRTARLWDAKSGRPIATFGPHPGFVDKVRISQDGQRVFTVSAGTVRIWNAQTGQLVSTLAKSYNTFTTFELSSSGARLFVGDGDGNADVWDAQSGEVKFQLKGHKSGLVAASFSPDDLRLLTVSEAERNNPMVSIRRARPSVPHAAPPAAGRTQGQSRERRSPR